MEGKKANWYSVIRYCANNLTGEIINVGIVMHSIDDEIRVDYSILDEHSPKIRAVTFSKTDIDIYKSFKDSLEFYLKKSSENLHGQVGDILIGSPYKDSFLEELYDNYQGKSMFLTRPKFSLTNDLSLFFNKMFEIYIGEKYLTSSDRQISVKKFMRSVFEERKLLNKKVKPDFEITPIETLDNVKIHIDFGFKNGVWNYLQAVPLINGPAKNTEWFAKTKFMFDNLDTDSKIHLMYRNSDFRENPETSKVLDYLRKMDNRVVTLDLDNHRRILELCDTIAEKAHDVDEYLIS
ncbi:DUF3037 domain-containing protein [Gracilibacillus dipsosauri]|uniref:DUF3037 domain-containing protein n=1 Tax=Gracilibacillus dipsosauri TaxID=178340 RepID=A0A317KXT1_9BACI|nr:DUF3037 domain-containing protein [Gracilibacillus dipsosauri]PWU68331.1 hypothetical protein DLJ74_07725 [Gracilibacillus dipsosauri]